ncbi:MAG: NrsF family protein [Bryobacteraceae bacterium]
MNCDGIKQRLSEGQPLTGSAEDHLASCPGCRAMLEALKPANEMPQEEHIDRIKALITASLEPVRPFPPDSTLISISVALFMAFSLVAAILVGYNGFHVLSAHQRLAYYSVITVCAILFSGATVQQMIPGSKLSVSPQWVIITALLSLILLATALFQNFDLDRFIKLGVPCLQLGSICALVSGALSCLVVRKGFSTSPMKTSTTVGFFAGLAGVAVLAFSCPIQNSAHIIVWHLGAMVLGGAGGAIIGAFWQRIPRKTG